VAQRLGGEEVGNIIRGGIPGTGMNGFSMSANEAGQVVGYLRTLGRTADTEIARGNPEKGKAIYDSSGCPACHMVSGHGAGVGPELTRVGSMRGPGYYAQRYSHPAPFSPKRPGRWSVGASGSFSSFP